MFNKCFYGIIIDSKFVYKLGARGAWAREAQNGLRPPRLPGPHARRKTAHQKPAAHAVFGCIHIIIL